MHTVRELERQIAAQREILKTGEPYRHRVAELEIERLEQRLENARRQEANIAKIGGEQKARRLERERQERAELEQRLIADYMGTVPGTTEAEARAALPDLLHQHRLREMDRVDREVARARARPTYRVG